jgi:hypothetical protein
MSLAPLLRHAGISVPRFVTVEGRIVFDPSAVAVPSYALEPHTFHDGPDPVISDTSVPWWIEDPDARAADVAAMREQFPGFTLFGDDGEYAYGGTIDTGRGRFECLVVPMPDRSLPSVVSLRKNLGRDEGQRSVKAPHTYLSGRLCIADTADWDADRHTTATAVAWTAHWFAAYTEWRLLGGAWPTEGLRVVA